MVNRLRIRTRHIVYNLVLSLLFVALITPTASAAAPKQTDDVIPVLLGEFMKLEMAAGESSSYVVTAPEDGAYLLTVTDDKAATSFTVTIVNEKGEEIVNDGLKQTELTLDAGDYTITFAAEADGKVQANLVGQLGSLSDDSSAPGAMVNGGFVVAEKVEGTQYATLTVDESPYWQLAILDVQAGEGDSYSLNVSGDNVYESLADSSQKEFLFFYTKGGEYTIDITPISGGSSLTLIPFLSGSAPSITLGEPMEATASPDKAPSAYQFEVSQAGALVTVTLESENDDADLDVFASVRPGDETYRTYKYGSNEEFSFIAPVAGTHFVEVITNNGDADFTLTVNEGDPAPEALANDRIWATVAAGQVDHYQLSVDEPGQMLTIMLIGPNDVDLDLRALLVNADGDAVHSLSTFSSSSAEVVAQSDAQTGLYEITVDGTYVDNDSNYVLAVTLTPSDEVAGQWAADAEASSEYGDDGYSALQATGAPDIAEAGDNQLAWASKEPDGPDETLTLIYQHAIIPTRIQIYESYNPGAISKIEALDAETDEWVVLWEGSAPAPENEPMRLFSPELSDNDFATQEIRITVANDSVSGWNEIDAVRLLGRP